MSDSAASAETRFHAAMLEIDRVAKRHLPTETERRVAEDRLRQFGYDP